MSRKILQDFWERHPDSESALREWFKTSLAASWKTLADVRQVYRNADPVKTPASGTLMVFDIRGNKYRLIVRVRYDWQLINIRAILTHAEYDQNKWKK